MMENGFLQFINEYGYLAVFLLVFLQEIGIPNPIPNELVLIFAGALTTVGDLNFWIVFLLAVLGDIIGTTLLFSVFYFFEHKIMERVKKWERINQKLETIKATLVKRGKFGIFLGRLMPYLRGYVSVAAGILNLPYRIFIPMAAASAVLWSGGYVVFGHFLGAKWRLVADFIFGYQWIILALLALIIIVIFYFKFRKPKTANLDKNKNL